MRTYIVARIPTHSVYEELESDISRLSSCLYVIGFRRWVRNLGVDFGVGDRNLLGVTVASTRVYYSGMNEVLPCRQTCVRFSWFCCYIFREVKARLLMYIPI